MFNYSKCWNTNELHVTLLYYRNTKLNPADTRGMCFPIRWKACYTVGHGLLREPRLQRLRADKERYYFRGCNLNRCCANCHGNHGARHTGCAKLQNSREVIRKAIESNIPFQEAIRQYEATKPPISSPRQIRPEYKGS